MIWDTEQETKVIIDEFVLQLTCFACPEQYDIFVQGKQVGYARLRGGQYTVSVPECSDDIVYYKDFMDDGWKGCFDNQKERLEYLTAGCNEIRKRRLA